MNNLTDHLESTLGKINGAWKDADGTIWPFYVLRFTGGPIAECITYSTLGLSDIPLQSSVSEKIVRHELLLMARPHFCDGNIPAVMYQIATEAIKAKRPYLRGDLIGPRGTLIPGTSVAGIYVTKPTYLPDSFSTYTSPEGISCAIAWLVPITIEEAEFIWNKGWEEFEDRLCSVNPDLLDLGRASLVASC